MTGAPNLCPDDKMKVLLTQLSSAASDGLSEVDELIWKFPLDPRLHFLRGSLLAGQRRYDEARAGMAEAVRIAPDYEIARFQLGFLHMTSGAPQEAAEVWEPLANLEPENPLRLFSCALNMLAQDEFDQALHYFSEGMRRNVSYPELNKDMMLLVNTIKQKQQDNGGEAISSAQMLLRQYKDKTKH